VLLDSKKAGRFARHDETNRDAYRLATLVPPAIATFCDKIVASARADRWAFRSLETGPHSRRKHLSHRCSLRLREHRRPQMYTYARQVEALPRRCEFRPLVIVHPRRRPRFFFKMVQLQSIHAVVAVRTVGVLANRLLLSSCCSQMNARC